jgi:hypothetical protein
MRVAAVAPAGLLMRLGAHLQQIAVVALCTALGGCFHCGEGHQTADRPRCTPACSPQMSRAIASSPATAAAAAAAVAEARPPHDAEGQARLPATAGALVARVQVQRGWSAERAAGPACSPCATPSKEGIPWTAGSPGSRCPLPRRSLHATPCEGRASRCVHADEPQRAPSARSSVPRDAPAAGPLGRERQHCRWAAQHTRGTRQTRPIAQISMAAGGGLPWRFGDLDLCPARSFTRSARAMPRARCLLLRCRKQPDISRAEHWARPIEFAVPHGLGGKSGRCCRACARRGATHEGKRTTHLLPLCNTQDLDTQQRTAPACNTDAAWCAACEETKKAHAGPADGGLLVSRWGPRAEKGACVTDSTRAAGGCGLGGGGGAP